MKKLGIPALAVISMLGLAVPAMADDPAAACGVMGCGIVVWLIMMVAILGGAVAVIVFIFKWIKKDARSRGMPNADNICFLALLGLLGLLIYVLMRPPGDVVPCPHCNMGRMQGLPQCPHCHQP